MGLVWSEHGVRSFRLPRQEEDVATLAPRMGPIREQDPVGWVEDLIRRVHLYTDGGQPCFSDVRLDWTAASAGDRRIYECLRAVEHGQTITYGEVARRAKAAGGALGVGQIMARNPWPLIVPCHRVVGANGKLVGFSAPGGIITKMRLLQLEGAKPPQDGQQASFAF
ncbi:methylated-DNA--[protein]-cysteine S-methyltransferase [Tianweitania sediminis]|uniref:Methylated-DNA--[protein]-cysteine S-methyltransferase n=2 Tax=Tianweitania sediminis TaxID=1502156 RepID=A0A8J7UJX0_9HYPH|nr:methylated-DNA--[protein]-cysteine S-methyltransferase [Tianweitania sediminis]MBP0439275.1 methylated-DNA--[protein]-cysteine S-methyltransferase [Tianweitania sediminis]